MSQDTCMASASCIVTWAVGIIRVQRYVTDFQWDIPTQLALYHGNYMEKMRHGNIEICENHGLAIELFGDVAQPC